jgi:hypothetical protein
MGARLHKCQLCHQRRNWGSIGQLVPITIFLHYSNPWLWTSFSFDVHECVSPDAFLTLTAERPSVWRGFRSFDWAIRTYDHPFEIDGPFEQFCDFAENNIHLDRLSLQIFITLEHKEKADDVYRDIQHGTGSCSAMSTCRKIPVSQIFDIWLFCSELADDLRIQADGIDLATFSLQMGNELEQSVRPIMLPDTLRVVGNYSRIVKDVVI